ncbi:MAG: hypothetical protein IJV64_06195 [Oscillospiraceae bacterium]|nr:hypothetical protein [Oscillospiraceae bacterium]
MFFDLRLVGLLFGIEAVKRRKKPLHERAVGRVKRQLIASVEAVIFDAAFNTEVLHALSSAAAPSGVNVIAPVSLSIAAVPVVRVPPKATVIGMEISAPPSPPRPVVSNAEAA